jgi:hypothetical protein
MAAWFESDSPDVRGVRLRRGRSRRAHERCATWCRATVHLDPLALNNAQAIVVLPAGRGLLPTCRPATGPPGPRCPKPRGFDARVRCRQARGEIIANGSARSTTAPPRLHDSRVRRMVASFQSPWDAVAPKHVTACRSRDAIDCIKRSERSSRCKTGRRSAGIRRPSRLPWMTSGRPSRRPFERQGCERSPRTRARSLAHAPITARRGSRPAPWGRCGSASACR